MHGHMYNDNYYDIRIFQDPPLKKVRNMCRVDMYISLLC